MVVLVLQGMFNQLSILGFGFLALIAYWTVCLFYVTADPIAPYTLKVGYKRGRYSNFNYFIMNKVIYSFLKNKIKYKSSDFVFTLDGDPIRRERVTVRFKREIK
jgi:hypothetical protein